MKKIICIGECALDIIFDLSQPIGAMPGGRIVNAAAMLARKGMHVLMASEASTDSVGDTVIRYLTDSGVDVHSVDRFCEGRTPVMIYNNSTDGTPEVARYEQYPAECFDIIWPRIDEGDIVVFGGFYALDPRMREHMLPLLHHAAERKAVLIYLPGFMPQLQPRITRVMPAILENLELADMVIARSNDLKLIFGTDSDAECYNSHIDFYCHSMVCVNTDDGCINYYSGKEVSTANAPESLCRSLVWNAGVVAGVVASLAEIDATPAMFDTPTDDMRCRVLDTAVAMARESIDALAHDWQRVH